jgi:peroxiredoxin
MIRSSMIAALSALAIGLLAGCKPQAGSDSSVPDSAATVASSGGLQGKAAPDFSLQTTSGDQTTLAKLKGNVVVLDFWATWCPPCRLSLPHIQKLSADQDKFKQGLRVLAVNAKETKAKIDPFIQTNNYTFVVPMDSQGQAMGKYGVEGIPTTVVIGRDGTVRAVFVGFDPNEGGKGVDAAVEAALAEK